MISKLGFLSSYTDIDKLDLDEYVTEKAMNGVFTMVAAEEKKICENSIKRTTDLLKKVLVQQDLAYENIEVGSNRAY